VSKEVALDCFSRFYLFHLSTVRLASNSGNSFRCRWRVTRKRLTISPGMNLAAPIQTLSSEATMIAISIEKTLITHAVRYLQFPYSFSGTQRGLDFTALNAAGDAPLHVACANGHYKTAASLLELGSAVNQLNRKVRLFGVAPLGGFGRHGAYPIWTNRLVLGRNANPPCCTIRQYKACENVDEVFGQPDDRSRGRIDGARCCRLR
jgi:hypothetical protein